MTEQVLTDEEKNALLDGVASGAVEVQTTGGQKYADVRSYGIRSGARIRSNSYPHLQILNQQVAERLAKEIAKNLHCEIAVVAEDISHTSFGQFCNTFESAPAVIPFAAPPLPGRALAVIDSATIGQLVEGFFGGANNDPQASSVVAFTPGEISVCRLFGNSVLAAVSDVWKSLVAFKPEPSSPVIGLELTDAVEERDAVIATRFNVGFSEGNGAFDLVWPVEMVRSLLPSFEGKKRERDPAADARWEKAIRARLTDALVSLDVTVGQVSKQLGELTKLKPGDVIEIGNPQFAFMSAGDVSVLQGRFGVHAGRNAFETTAWVDPDSTE